MIFLLTLQNVLRWRSLAFYLIRRPMRESDISHYRCRTNNILNDVFYIAWYPLKRWFFSDFYYIVRYPFLGGDIEGDGNVSNNTNGDTASSELNRSIRTEVQQLSERWSTLLHRSELWQRRLENGLPVGINSAAQDT